VRACVEGGDAVRVGVRVGAGDIGVWACSRCLLPLTSGSWALACGLLQALTAAAGPPLCVALCACPTVPPHSTLRICPPLLLHDAAPTRLLITAAPDRCSLTICLVLLPHAACRPQIAAGPCCRPKVLPPQVAAGPCGCPSALWQELEELDEEEKEMTKAKNDAYEALQVCGCAHAWVWGWRGAGARVCMRVSCGYGCKEREGACTRACMRAQVLIHLCLGAVVLMLSLDTLLTL